MMGNGGSNTGIKRHKPEEIVSQLRRVDVLVGQGTARIDAIRGVGIVRKHQTRPDTTNLRRAKQSCQNQNKKKPRNLFRLRGFEW
jgi:hypothetical protein